MSAILAPNNYVSDSSSSSPRKRKDSPKRLTIYSYKQSLPKTISKSHCEDCYCRETPDKPSLTFKSFHCDQPNDKKETNETFSSLLSDELLEKAHRTVNYTPESSFLKKLKEESHKKCGSECWGSRDVIYTDRRAEYDRNAPYIEQDYAAYRLGILQRQKDEYERRKRCDHGVKRLVESPKNQEKDSSVELLYKGNQICESVPNAQRISSSNEDFQCLKNEAIQPKQTESSNPNGPSSRTVNENEHCSCCKCQARFSTMTTNNARNFSDIRDFRQRNYFDTHSLIELSASKDQEDKQPHVCVHEFVLNNRLMPEPVNSDSYGISRCTICNKAMQKPDLAGKKSDSRVKLKVTKQGNVKATVGNDNDSCFLPRQLNIGSGNEKIHLKVPFDLIKKTEDDTDLVKHFRQRLKRPVPRNTLALRFQKGVA